MDGRKLIAEFDSSAAMVRATSRFLRGKDFPMMGFPRILEPFAIAAGMLPRAARDRISILGGWSETVPVRKLKGTSIEPIYGWVTSSYPDRRSQAVAVGASSGALVHLCAALQIAWLPQTFLIPVRRGVHPDEPKQAIEAGREPAEHLLEANPDISLHQMHDANQDRLMIRVMSYFRAKRRRLGPAYEAFIERTLEPGGTILLIESERAWPTTRLGDRYVFQHGAVGGANPDEFLRGSERVEKYLRHYGSDRTRWDSPIPDDVSPEAEWGFDEALRDDVERFAHEHGYRVRRLVLRHENDLSPFVAELYRWWYRARRMLANRLLVESFMIMEPWWTLRTGSAPFWMTFNMEPDRRHLLDYLDAADPYDEINVMLFNHGTDSVGLPSIDEWKAVPERARRGGSLLGQREDKWPLDHGSYARYYHDVRRRISARYPLPGPLALATLDRFIAERGDRYPFVRWADQPVRL